MQRGKCIFTMTCSFQIPEPEQIVQNLPMPSPFDAPSFPEPEACQATEERIAHFMMDMEGLLPDKIKSYLQTLMDERRQSRIEIRSAMPDDYADFWQACSFSTAFR